MAVHPEAWRGFRQRQDQYQKSLELRIKADELLEEADRLGDRTPTATNEALLSMLLDLDERLRKLEERE